MELVEIRKKLKKVQDKDRYEHTKGVMYTAGCLAMAYGYDMQKAMLAGLLHDCAKCIPNDEKLRLCEENDILISSVERENPFLLHAKLGALLAKTEYDVTDPLILHAIKVHTTGEPDMNILDKIIYIADYIEPNRNKAANLDCVRELAFHASPSETTAVGRKILAEHPGTTGSLGCAISEAVEAATSQEGYRYVLGSVLNQVLLHQSVIGLETKAAMDKYGIQADIVIGCAGGGSNLGGLISPFVGEKLRGEADYRIIAVEPASCPSLTRGKFAYDFCDTGMVCPLAKMYTLGSGFIPSANHAGGLRYHGMSPVVSQLYHDGLIEATSVEQTKVFEAATYFARVEGILPAPESSHAIRVAIDEALKCKETGEEKTIVFGLTGTGYFDMVAYEKFNNGEMNDYIPTDDDLAQGFAGLPQVD